MPAEAEVIDLTASPSPRSEEATADVTSITPDRPTKRIRVSRRLKALREQEEESKKSKVYRKEKGGCDGDEEKVIEDDTPEYEGKHTNGYFEVDEVLDRRTRKYGSESAGLRHVVEYRKSTLGFDFMVPCGSLFI